MTLNLEQYVGSVHLDGNPTELKLHKQAFNFGNERQFSAFEGNECVSYVFLRIKRGGKIIAFNLNNVVDFLKC